MTALVNLLLESSSQFISSPTQVIMQLTSRQRSRQTERERETENRLDIFIPTGVMSHSGNHPGLWGLSHPPVDDVLECDLWTNLFSRSHNNKLRYLASALHYYIYFWQSNTFSPVLSKNNCRKVFSLHWYSVEELADLGEAALRRNCSTSTHFLTC